MMERPCWIVLLQPLVYIRETISLLLFTSTVDRHAISDCSPISVNGP
jgi:hypothetical protein